MNADEAYLRIAGASRLDEAGLRALRGLARWREQTAEARNRARGFVVSDAGLLELARLRPRHRRGTAAVEHLHPRALARHERDLLQMIGAAAADRSPIQRIRTARRRTAAHAQPDAPAWCRHAPRPWRSIRPCWPRAGNSKNCVRAGTDPDAIPERFLGWRRPVITDELLTIMG